MHSQLVILAVLARAGTAMTGLQIVRDEPERLAMGSVYIHLLRLQDLGEVTSELEPLPSKPRLQVPVRCYRITARGRKRLSDSSQEANLPGNAGLAGA